MNSVAKHHRMSRRYLEMLFARRDESPAAYLRGLRMEEARRCLQTVPVPDVSEVAHRVGYRDATSFIRAYRRRYQETPGATRSRTNTQRTLISSSD
ncbi:helix-turn-helix transcriptional regulator [Rhodococcus qingshengii]|uniref:helix-turn-helix transcriptional regulator n=1 Tax=Rhodococcus qingshengii TaxID=334542 RepID=UPI003558AF39